MLWLTIPMVKEPTNTLLLRAILTILHVVHTFLVTQSTDILQMDMLLMLLILSSPHAPAVSPNTEGWKKSRFVCTAVCRKYLKSAETSIRVNLFYTGGHASRWYSDVMDSNYITHLLIFSTWCLLRIICLHNPLCYPRPLSCTTLSLVLMTSPPQQFGHQAVVCLPLQTHMQPTLCTITRLARPKVHRCLLSTPPTMVSMRR